MRKRIVALILIGATLAAPVAAQSWQDRRVARDAGRDFDDDRGERRRDVAGDRRDWRDGRRDRWDDRRDRWDGRRGWNDRRQGNWDGGWRNDRRYDWRGWRDRNRNVYRLPRYYPPRGGYGYRRWAPGYRIQPYFYGSNYWINDPWAYRLPPAYDGYRWVRYYDDVMLIDVQNGLIADIIHSFFWR